MNTSFSSKILSFPSIKYKHVHNSTSSSWGVQCSSLRRIEHLPSLFLKAYLDIGHLLTASRKHSFWLSYKRFSKYAKSIRLNTWSPNCSRESLDALVVSISKLLIELCASLKMTISWTFLRHTKRKLSPCLFLSSLT